MLTNSTSVDNIGFVRFASVIVLDSGLRRNDGLMDYLGCYWLL